MSKRNHVASASNPRVNNVTGMRTSRPESIPGMAESPTGTATGTASSTTAAARSVRNTRSSAKSSSSGDDSPVMLSPDGAELVESSATEGPGLAKAEPTIEAFECAICLQTCVHPVKLPCTHIFCFLCIKGVAIQSKRCALCRQSIPIEFCSDPMLLRKEDLLKELSFEGGCQWYYQGMNGWWQYDERASADIEEHFKKGEKHLEMLIAGFLYVVDFENMLQYRRNDPSRRRKIKRDLTGIPDRKGVAGLKIVTPDNSSPHRLSGDGGENVPCVVQARAALAAAAASPVASGNSGSLSPSPPHNTPEESQGPEEPDLVDQMADLNLTPRSTQPTRSSRSSHNQTSSSSSDDGE